MTKLMKKLHLDITTNEKILGLYLQINLLYDIILKINDYESRKIIEKEIEKLQSLIVTLEINMI